MPASSNWGAPPGLPQGTPHSVCPDTLEITVDTRGSENAVVVVIDVSGSMEKDAGGHGQGSSSPRTVIELECLIHRVISDSDTGS